MIGLIVTGHGNFASGLTSSLNLIAGPQEHYVAVDFTQEVEQLEADLNAAMDQLKDCGGIVVLSDLPGGSPFKTAVLCGAPRGNVEVVAGTNLPMLCEISMTRKFLEEMSAEQLADAAVNCGKDQILRYVPPIIEEVEAEDGI